MNSNVKSGSNEIPESWRAKFREWGSIGGRRGRREDKVRAALKSWAPGGGNYRRRKHKPQPNATPAQQNSYPDIQRALQQINNA